MSDVFTSLLAVVRSLGGHDCMGLSLQEFIRKIGNKCTNVSLPVPGPSQMTALHMAVMKGQVDAVHMLLELEASVNAKTADGYTALHIATEQDNLDVVNVLLVTRVDLDAVLPYVEHTALHIACQHRSDGIALALVQRGADMDIPDVSGQTPLVYAVYKGKFPVVKEMIKLGAKPLNRNEALLMLDACKKENMKDMLKLLIDSGWANWPAPAKAEPPPIPTGVADGRADALLHQCVEIRNASGLEQLLQTAENPDVTNAEGFTPLHLACTTGDLRLVKPLILAGSQAGAKSNTGLTPLHLAAREDHPSVASALIVASSAQTEDTGATQSNPPCSLVDTQDNQGRFPLHLAAETNSVSVIEILIKARGNVDCRDKANRTPLHCATSMDQLQAVKALLTAGASVDVTNSAHLSPLHISMTYENHAIAQVLLDAGASADEGGLKVETSLHWACRRNSSAVESLLQAGALPGHCWNDKLQSPLHVACAAGHVEAAKLLLPRLSPRQINMHDKVISPEEGGDTALLIAIRHRHVKVVDALLEGGADPNFRQGSTNLSPLHVAVSKEGKNNGQPPEPRLVRALVAAGANMAEIGPNGVTPLQLACLHGSSGEVVQVLLEGGADTLAPCAGKQFLPSLHLAACGGDVGALRVFLGLPECGGVNQEGPAPIRATPLSLAVMHGCAETVRFLLEEGADMEALPFEDNGSTPLAHTLIHLAASIGHGEIISLLMQAKHFKEDAERESLRTSG